MTERKKIIVCTKPTEKKLKKYSEWIVITKDPEEDELSRLIPTWSYGVCFCSGGNVQKDTVHSGVGLDALLIFLRQYSATVILLSAEDWKELKLEFEKPIVPIGDIFYV